MRKVRNGNKEDHGPLAKRYMFAQSSDIPGQWPRDRCLRSLARLGFAARPAPRACTHRNELFELKVMKLRRRDLREDLVDVQGARSKHGPLHIFGSDVFARDNFVNDVAPVLVDQGKVE
jgi:hypothetical protein